MCCVLVLWFSVRLGFCCVMVLGVVLDGVVLWFCPLALGGVVGWFCVRWVMLCCVVALLCCVAGWGCVVLCCGVVALCWVGLCCCDVVL